MDDGSRLCVADEEAVQEGHEHLSRVRDHHHLGLGQGALHVVEMEDLVVGDEAHLDGRALRTLLSERGVGGTGRKCRETVNVDDIKRIIYDNYKRSNTTTAKKYFLPSSDSSLLL